MVSFRGTRDLAFVGRFFADDHAKQRRLAGAIGTDEPDLFSGIDLQRGVDEENLSAVLLADVREGDHSSFYRLRSGCLRHPNLMRCEAGIIPVNACRSNSPLYTGERFLGCRARFEHP